MRVLPHPAVASFPVCHPCLSHADLLGFLLPVSCVVLYRLEQLPASLPPDHLCPVWNHPLTFLPFNRLCPTANGVVCALGHLHSLPPEQTADARSLALTQGPLPWGALVGICRIFALVGTQWLPDEWLFLRISCNIYHFMNLLLKSWGHSWDYSPSRRDFCCLIPAVYRSSDPQAFGRNESQ